MDKNQYFDEYHFLVQNDRYILREQLLEDKDDYYKLCVETSLLAKRMSRTSFRAFLKNSGSRDVKKMRYIFQLY